MSDDKTMTIAEAWAAGKVMVALDSVDYVEAAHHMMQMPSWAMRINTE